MNTTKKRWSKAPIGVLLCLLMACIEERPLVEKFQEGAWEPETFQVVSLTGRRDGIMAFFSLELRGEGERRLVLEGCRAAPRKLRFVQRSATLPEAPYVSLV